MAFGTPSRDDTIAWNDAGPGPVLGTALGEFVDEADTGGWNAEAKKHWPPVQAALFAARQADSARRSVPPRAAAAPAGLGDDLLRRLLEALGGIAVSAVSVSGVYEMQHMLCLK